MGRKRAGFLAGTANELAPVTVQIQPSGVERVVPNALFDSAIRKRLEDKSLHPRYRANRSLARSAQSASRFAQGLGMKEQGMFKSFNH
jgi:hypothetical protein